VKNNGARDLHVKMYEKTVELKIYASRCVKNRDARDVHVKMCDRRVEGEFYALGCVKKQWRANSTF
jgi:hypothetical protein